MDQIQLNIVSYNCNSLRKNIDIVRALLVKCDILVLQEIILLDDDDIGLINDISDQINFIATPSTKANSNSLDGKPSGGKRNNME